MKIKVESILQYLKTEKIEYTVAGNTETEVSGFSSLNNYRSGTMTWVKKKENLKERKEFTVVFAEESFDLPEAECIIVCNGSKHAFFSTIEHFFSVDKKMYGIGAGTYISPDVKIGKNVTIGANCTIDGNIFIGDNTIIYNNVSLINSVEIGMNCVIQSGTVIGHDDLGYTKDKDGKIHMIKHYGGVRIGDNVLVSPNCVINRGTIDDTMIGAGTKIDCLCHVAHNCIIGEDVTLVAGSLIYGSARIDNGAYVTSAIVKNQLNVGMNAFIGMGAVVTKDVEPEQTVVGIPAKPQKKGK